ncbi:unnamed protein product [Cylindrotheca closterium]|uniref:Helicase-associated domain-containing protein n=1 Tax=Cylindrotheca closterium TaxID=2856 RepID=A0AAD2FM71_9STRA|nr:unnamed protein product [Cylindrotheca closterium]
MASTILLLPQLGLATAFKPNLPPPPVSHRYPQQVSLIMHRPTIFCQHQLSAATAAAADESEVTQVSSHHDWDEQFEELQSFKEGYGHCNFPYNAPVELQEQYPTLARFCRDQRLEYHNYKYKLSSQSIRRMTLPNFDRTVRLRRLDELGFEFNSKLAQWYDKYHELLQYRDDNGHLRVTDEENRSLKGWIIAQRCMRKGTEGYSKLSEAQTLLLDKIGFEWEPRDDLWMAKYIELCDFRKKHGHLNVPHTSSVYRWIYRQQARRAEKKNHSPLSEEQLQLLDDVDFPWIPIRFDRKWQVKYDELARFKKNHGHCRPSASTHLKMITWSRVQREKRRKGQLSSEQIRLLDKIGFPWVSNNPHQFPAMYQQLNDYYKKHDHLRVSQDDDPDLYSWMTTQRERYHGIGTEPPMSDLEIEKMEDLHFCWSLDWKSRVWHEKYTEIAEFYKEHGHVNVTEKENPSLYNWIQMQEKRYEETTGHKPLSQEELELLEQIDFHFFKGKPRIAWNSMYNELEKYRKVNGERFPNHEDDPDLNRWMRQQRHRMRSEYGSVPLSVEEKSILESIEFPIFPKGKHRRIWYERYDELVEFWKKHGHFLVDPDQPLNPWIDKQRGRNRDTCLEARPISKSEVYLLDRIGFPWVSDREDVEWQMRYDELVQFRNKHGRMPANRLEPRLYSWMRYQRDRYFGMKGKDISANQIKQLENIGFRWTGKF